MPACLIGYSRVSTLEEELHLQLDGLKAAHLHRPGKRLDRLGRSVRNLIDITKHLKRRKE